jgi:dipeptidyl aminopeptidase/acylaminoacyl peptidase
MAQLNERPCKEDAPMNENLNTWCSRTLQCLLLALCATTAARADLATDYTRAPELQSVHLSPAGQSLATLSNRPGQPARLAILDLKTGNEVTSDVADTTTRIKRFAWVNEQRLLFEVQDISNDAWVLEGRAGLYAVDRDGSNFRELIAWRRSNDTTSTRIASRALNYEWDWEGVIQDGSADIWVRRGVRDGRGEWTNNQYARLNTQDGSLRNVSLGAPEHVSHWLRLGAGKGDVVTSHWLGRQQLHYRPDAAAAWQLLQDVDALDGDTWHPLALINPGELLVLANAGQDTEALYALDLAKRQLASEPLIAVKGFDLRPLLMRDGPDGPLLGIRLAADAPVSVWFDRGMDQLQRSVDASLPKGRSNQILCTFCASAPNVVVRSGSDTHPGEYYLFDRQKLALKRVGDTRPWLDEKTQGRRSLQRVPTRDGLSMPLYITHPAGHANDERLPAVVLVHGGPWVRGADLTWEAEAQYLAALGYRVLEPEFRGSTGYGHRWANAGRQAWGRAMQDDLLDAVQWASERGLVDRQRVCIMGGSYGGYAALMGAVRDGQAYRCAVSFAGVTDIELMHTVFRSDVSEQSKEYVYKRLIGDPTADAQREVSPLRRVADIKVPVLLMHGALDRRVPIDHARQFASAARAVNAPVELVVYDREGHGFFNPSNRADYLRRVTAFLAQHLRAQPANAGAR